MRILVTGGAGFIGSNMVRFLMSDEAAECGLQVDRVVTLDKLTYASSRLNLTGLKGDDRHHLIVGDVGDSPLVMSLLAEHQIDAVIHLAAESHVDRSIQSPDAFMDSNVVGTYRLLEAVKNFWQDPANRIESPRFLHVSTDEVFGPISACSAPANENSAYSPSSPYSASKAASDHWVTAYHRTYDLPVMTTWSSNNYGPHQHMEKLIPLMIQKLVKGQPLPIYGDGKQRRDWLHVWDHCRALAMVLARGELGAGYCIAGNHELENLEVVKAIHAQVTGMRPELAKKSWESQVEHVADRAGHDRRYAMSTQKIESELGWQPQVSFREGLTEVVRWYLDHPDRLEN